MGGSLRGRAHLKGRVRATRRSLLLALSCPGAYDCSGRLKIAVGHRTIARGPYSVAASRTAYLRLPLTGAGRRLVASETGETTAGRVRLRIAFIDAVGRSHVARFLRLAPRAHS